MHWYVQVPDFTTDQQIASLAAFEPLAVEGVPPVVERSGMDEFFIDMNGDPEDGPIYEQYWNEEDAGYEYYDDFGSDYATLFDWVRTQPSEYRRKAELAFPLADFFADFMD